MPENEFEKKVSAELGGLKLKPSDEVWTKVEERIRKKNKRRVFIIFFLLAGLALFGWWQWGYFFGEKKNDIVKNETPVKKTTAEKQTAIDEETKSSEPITITEESKDNKGLIETEKKKEDKLVDKNISKIKQVAIEKNQPRKKDEKKKISKPSGATVKNRTDVRQKIPDGAQMEVTQTDAAAKLSPKKDAIVINDANEKIELKQSGINQVEVNPVENKIDSAKTEVAGQKNEADVIKDASSKVVSLKDSAAASVVQKKIPGKKWKWGIEFTPGISSFKNDFLVLNMNKSADVFTSPVTSAGGAAAPAGPSTSNAGFTLQLGGFAQKQFTRRSSLTVGLRYAYYSDVIHIGMPRNNLSNNLSLFLDSRGASQAYGASGDTVAITNQYHFIELPVYYNLQLNKNKTNPLTLKLGFKAGRMFASNAFVYDTTAGGIYYRSKTLFNKTQFGISASLNWAIINKPKFQWAIGPVVDFHLNSLLNNPLDKKKYLVFAGLRSTIIFNSKK